MNQEIKDLFNQIKHKQSFCANLATYLKQSKTSVCKRWFYIDGTIPTDLIPKVIDKLKKEIKEEKIKHEKVWFN